MGRPMKSVIRACGITLAAAAFVLTGNVETGGISTPAAHAQESSEGMSLNELLRAVRQGRAREREENRRREAEFRADQASQQQKLDQAEADLVAEQERSEQLEATRDQNELDIAALQDQLRETLGNAGELFGVVRQVATDTVGQIEQSLVSAQIPNRDDALESLTVGRVLPTIEQLETLWATLIEEMIEQGRTVSFQGEFTQTDGNPTAGEIVRVGPFVAMVKSTGEFLAYESETDSLKMLPRQPAARFLDAADQLVSAGPGEETVGTIDPSQGALLSLLVRTPSTIERVDQGGTIGRIIIGLGALGILLALWRFFALSVVALQVRSQMRKPEKPSKGNALGRMLMVYEDVKDRVDEETLELKLDEAFLKERPKLEFGLGTVKVLAAVAPLLGLLGTVTGMIIVFQQITLFGTGDPKIMAGGISQALMTTVLGLCAAIPLLILHSIAAGRSREVIQILEEQSAGLVASRAESRN